MAKFTRLLEIAALIALIYYVGFLFGNKSSKDKFVLAITRNSVYQQKAEEFQRIKEIKFYQDQERVLKSITQGQADAGIIDGLVALNFIHQKPGFQDLRLAGNFLYREPVAVAFNRSDDSLRRAVNRGLAEIVANGIYESISYRYFGRDISVGLKITPAPDKITTDDDAWKKRRMAGELRFAMSGDNPPFCYRGERNQLTGFDVDLAWEVCIQLGIRNFIPVLVKQQDLLTGLNAGQYDGIWNSMRINEANLAELDFSNPYYVTGPQLVVPKKSPITGPEILIPPVFPEPPPVSAGDMIIR